MYFFLILKSLYLFDPAYPAACDPIYPVFCSLRTSVFN